MEKLRIKIQRLSKKAVMPTYAHLTDAGMDLTAVNYKVEGDTIIYGTGLAIEIPTGYVGLIYPRSSVYKTDLTLANSVGVIDSGYRGEIKIAFKMKNALEESLRYPLGTRVAQLLVVPYPKITLEEVSELTESLRGVDGFGSTGK